MHVIKSENETVSHHYTHHVLLMAAVPVICAFIGTTQIGWNFGDGTVVQLSGLPGFILPFSLWPDAGRGGGYGTRHSLDGT